MKKIEKEPEFTSFGILVFEAIDKTRNHTAEEIAEVVGEPVCVVKAMLAHLEQVGFVDATFPKKVKKARR